MGRKPPGRVVESLPIDGENGNDGKKGRRNMSSLEKETKKEIARLEKMIKTIDAFKEQAPQGCLKIQNRGGDIYFFKQYLNENTKKWERKYIKKSDISVARDLAQKHYYSMIKPLLEENLQVLNCFAEQYKPKEIGPIYDKLSSVRKTLVIPLLDEKTEIIKKWQEESYEKNNAYSENLRYETEQGELVRSKSEVIMSNLLYRYRGDILYKYEQPLSVVVAGVSKTIYPDFTILNLHTGKITYWEHAGLMDDADYANDFVRKVNTYTSNNLLPGRDVVFSYETQEMPLEISVIRKMVEEIRKW